jgi:hypothetical protein
MKDERRKRLAVRLAVVSACALLSVAGLITLAPDVASDFRQPQATQYESPAVVSLDPDRVEFGKQVIGVMSRAHRVVVTNTGGATLYINSVVVGGEDPAAYSIDRDTCTGKEVVPYRACIIDITFFPRARDDFNAELKLTDNASDSPQTVRLTGEGMNSINVPPGSVAGTR